MSLIIRVLGIAVGLVMLLMGGWLIYKPVFGNMLESLNAVVFILLGFLFITVLPEEVIYFESNTGNYKPVVVDA
ncbi:hypothetical protein PSI9734_00446 [Pseudidiomarina piscicola]|uniref:Uncharacterized protein n=1 Tax=Pseudidiomarina piscicola TaxID=2614830 RepID=A0A6S6WLQ4_9GAMM|nr:hypothetical protein [Pseudidiomarina piscicola]CAB0149871.1 hypothetical protein PSI9734_00446 [Pseudidiomarina piscicola]VZT39318.1 hypothetical protein PSI9734_00446 [Pseudomonas aeruginosa]